MNDMNHAELGTIIEGTLRPQDVLPALADALDGLVQDNAEHWCGRQDERDAFLNLVWEAREIDFEVEDDAERCDDLSGELMDALSYFAPEGAYFGAHEGNGADFGFWMSDDEVFK